MTLTIEIGGPPLSQEFKDIFNVNHIQTKNMIFNDEKLFKSSYFQQFCCNCRHYNASITLFAHAITTIPPAIRYKADIIRIRDRNGDILEEIDLRAPA